MEYPRLPQVPLLPHYTEEHQAPVLPPAQFSTPHIVPHHSPSQHTGDPGVLWFMPSSPDFQGQGQAASLTSIGSSRTSADSLSAEHAATAQAQQLTDEQLQRYSSQIHVGTAAGS